MKKMIYVLSLLLYLGCFSNQLFASINVYGLYSFADYLELGYDVDYSEDENRYDIDSTLEYENDPTGGVGAEIELKHNDYSSLIIGAQYNFEREYTSQTIKDENDRRTEDFDEPLTLSYSLAYINMTSKLSEDVFIFGGVNYSFPQFYSGNYQNYTFHEDVGYQFGVGLYLKKSLSLNVFYEQVNFSVDYSSEGSGGSSDQEISYASEENMKILAKIHFN
jgi:hypothetical protein